jgi:hypothetical protein
MVCQAFSGKKEQNVQKVASGGAFCYGYISH